MLRLSRARTIRATRSVDVPSLFQNCLRTRWALVGLLYASLACFGATAARSQTASGSCPTTNCTVGLSWSQPTQTAGETITGTQITRGGVLLGTVGPTTLTFTDPSVPPGTYAYAVTNVDAAGNKAAVGVTLTVTSSVTPPPPPPPPTCSGETLFPLAFVPTTTLAVPTDVNELGIKITFAKAGTVSCARFYKLASDTHTSHSYAFWSSTGAKLTSGNFTAETASGWQIVTLPTALLVAAGQTITFSVNTGSGGHYADTQSYYTKSITTGDLTTGVNAGVYNPGATQTFPKQFFNASNYWRDVYFTATIAPPPPLSINCPVATSGVSNLPSGPYTMTIASGSASATCTGTK